jgi:hypothetical protein
VETVNYGRTKFYDTGPRTSRLIQGPAERRGGASRAIFRRRLAKGRLRRLGGNRSQLFSPSRRKKLACLSPRKFLLARDDSWGQCYKTLLFVVYGFS